MLAGTHVEHSRINRKYVRDNEGLLKDVLEIVEEWKSQFGIFDVEFLIPNVALGVNQ